MARRFTHGAINIKITSVLKLQPACLRHCPIHRTGCVLQAALRARHGGRRAPALPPCRPQGSIQSLSWVKAAPKHLRLTHKVHLQIAWWKRAALVMDPPAARSPSQWKPAASASPDTAQLYRRVKGTTAPPAPRERGLLLLTAGCAAREVLGRFPALTTAILRSFALLHKRRRPWRDCGEGSCTGSERKAAPPTPKTRLLLPPIPAPAPARAGGHSSGAVGHRQCLSLIGNPNSPCSSDGCCSLFSHASMLQPDLHRHLHASWPLGPEARGGISARFFHQHHFASTKGTDAWPGAACGKRQAPAFPPLKTLPCTTSGFRAELCSCGTHSVDRKRMKQWCQEPSRELAGCDSSLTSIHRPWVSASFTKRSPLLRTMGSFPENQLKEF